MLKLCLFPQLDHMVMYLLIQGGGGGGGGTMTTERCFELLQVLQVVLYTLR